MRSSPLRLFADMGLSWRVVESLRDLGFDVVHASEIGLARADDQALLSFASQEKRLVITFDLDFGEIVAKSPAEGIGVILLRLRDTSSGFVLRRIRTVIASCADDLAASAIVSVEDKRFRVRKFFPR